jgi:hypothetical protein
MNALGARNIKLFLRLRRRFFQRESRAESEEKGAVCYLNSVDPSQMYTRREIVGKVPQKAGVQSGRIDSREEPEV